jgi:hypothetical protein
MKSLIYLMYDYYPYNNRGSYNPETDKSPTTRKPLCCAEHLFFFIPGLEGEPSARYKKKPNTLVFGFLVVGDDGFEPPTPWV